MMGIIGMCNWTYRWFRVEGRSSLTEIGDQFARLAVNGLAIAPDPMAASSSLRPEQSLNGR
jgi:hypothetical protein